MPPSAQRESRTAVRASSSPRGKSSWSPPEARKKPSNRLLQAGRIPRSVVWQCGDGADNQSVSLYTVECLRCGEARELPPWLPHGEPAGECPRCGYVGWAYSNDLTERTRKLFRDLPVERRQRLRTL
jgi:Zn ribbon nucleic-acid-binding protein